MWTTFLALLGSFSRRVATNFLSLLKAARADDPRLFDFVKSKVAEVEEKLGSGNGGEKQKLVRIDAKKYGYDLGRDVATAGIDALILSAMQELGLVH